MNQFVRLLVCSCVLGMPGLAQSGIQPFLGRWDINAGTPEHPRAMWLGVAQNNGKTEIQWQPSGGNVFSVSDFKVNGSHLTIVLNAGTSSRPAVTLEVDPNGKALDIVEKRGDHSTSMKGEPAPALDRPAPKSWSEPEALFDGKDLNGWEPIGDASKSHWTVKDGVLFNEAHGANLRTTRTFTDFKVHYEVNCPEGGNSGFYLRGRYEVQVEAEPLTSNPPERRLGSIYGRITPNPAAVRTPGQWQTFDVTLVGRTVTVVQNGATIIQQQHIDGITGGALDANEGEPGPFYIQGDHTGGLQYRNIRVSVGQ
jgi:hypothetical protein